MSAEEKKAAEEEAAAKAEAKARRFLRRLMNASVAKAFSQWQDITDSVNRLKAMVMRWSQRELAKAFDTWCSINEKSGKGKEVADVMEKFIKRLKNQKLAMGWEAWHSMWEEIVEAKAKLSKAASRMKHPGLMKAWNRWAEVAEARKEKMRQMRRALASSRPEGKAWNTWKAYVEPYRIIRKAAKALANQPVRKGFNAWVDATMGGEEAQRKKNLMRGFIGRLANMELSRGFTAWKGRVQERADAWNKLKRVTGRWRMIGAAMAWDQWAGLASEKKRKEQLMIRFAGRLANMEVARAWASWVDMCDSKDKMRGALMGIAQPMLRKTWLGWVRFHQMHNESKLKKAGRFAWGIEHAVASFIWGIEQTAEHVFHLDRRARRATANARRRALMGIGGEDSESEDGDDDIPHRMKTRMRSRRIEPMYSDYDPGIYGLRPGDGPFEHRRVLRADGGYLSEHGYITQPIADAQQDATAAYLRVQRYAPLMPVEPPSYVRQASSSVESRLRAMGDDGAGAIGVRGGPVKRPSGVWSGDPSRRRS